MNATEKTLKLLKLKHNEKGLTTSAIAGFIGLSYFYAKQLLSRLEKENKIEKIEMTRMIFWRIK